MYRFKIKNPPPIFSNDIPMLLVLLFFFHKFIKLYIHTVYKILIYFFTNPFSLHPWRTIHYLCVHVILERWA